MHERSKYFQRCKQWNYFLKYCFARKQCNVISDQFVWRSVRATCVNVNNLIRILSPTIRLLNTHNIATRTKSWRTIEKNKTLISFVCVLFNIYSKKNMPPTFIVISWRYGIWQPVRSRSFSICLNKLFSYSCFCSNKEFR